MTIVATEYANYGLAGAQAMAWLQSWLWLPGVMLLLCFLPLYFPDGRLVSRRWRWVVRLALFSCVTGAALYALSPGEIPETEGIDNPLGIEALKPISDLLEPVHLALYFLLWFASVASLMVRFRRSGSLERQQIKWLAFAASAVPVWFLINVPIEAASRTLFDVMEALIFVALIPITAGVAILRYRLYDIDVIINRTLVYGALTATLALVLLRGRNGDPDHPPSAHRPRGASATRHRGLYPCDSGPVRPVASSSARVRGQALLPQQVRLQNDPDRLQHPIARGDGAGYLNR
jgi:hypothetical protein